jgi:aminoglycoside 2'-N-acetyltransferase I
VTRGVPASAYESSGVPVVRGLLAGRVVASERTGENFVVRAGFGLEGARSWTKEGRAMNTQLLAVSSLSEQEQEDIRSDGLRVSGLPDSPHCPASPGAEPFSAAPPVWAVLVKSEGRVVSHAGILPRVVLVDGQRVPVGGIGGVLTLPQWQRRGCATATLTTAGAFIGGMLGMEFGLLLCPVALVPFYRKRGWQAEEGPVVCDQPQGPVALSQSVAMVLPLRSTAWPKGTIDLCGAPW